MGDRSLAFCVGFFFGEKAPLCKGGSAAGGGGLWLYEGKSIYGQGHNPSVSANALPPPFTQGRLLADSVYFIVPDSTPLRNRFREIAGQSFGSSPIPGREVF